MGSEIGELKNPVILELSKHLKTDSKSGILSCLERIKDDPKCSKQFFKDGGLGLLIKLFSYQKFKILNLLLSILANACLVSHIRQEVQGTKIAIHAVSILKNIKLGNILRCRACRLIGNLSECSCHATTLCEAGVVKVLSNVLKSSSNIPLSLMAIRAVRNIWISLESSQEEILESGAIRHITATFIQAVEESIQNSSKHRELVEVCLKAMCALLGGLDPRSGDHMRGENDVQGYRYIIDCCMEKNKKAIKCLHSLCQIAECRPILGSVGAVECVIDLTMKNSPSWEVLVSLCLFSREAVNRAKIRSGSGLDVMLALLKKDECEKYHPMLLHALAQFVYDDQSIFIMVKNGLLDVLVKKLKQMILEIPKESEERTASKKRPGDTSTGRADLKYNRTNYGRFSLDYRRDDWSPGSAASICSSPPSTPPLPFYENEVDDNAEDNYSPVCSDNEWADNEEEPQEEVESLKSSSSLIADMEETQETGKGLKVIANEHVNAWTLTLLSRLSHHDEPIEKLGDPSTIEPLTTYIRMSKSPRASRILTRIVRNRTYLIPLLKQGFVFEAQTLYGSEQYTRQLCALAETGGALGEFASILVRGQESHRFMVAVSIPFLIKSRDGLRNLLNNHGGLSLIFRVLADREHSLHENAICSISCLANSLEIRPDSVDRSQWASDLVSSTAISCSESFDGRLLKPSTVTFELDDGSTVDACRNFLCQKSDFFSAMLQGSFSESGKKRVKLKNTSKDGLDTLLLAARGDVFDNRTIESLLDAVLLADKFLMFDVSKNLTEFSVTRLNFENFSRAWNWARNNECYELKTCCVKIFLTAKISRAERVQAFYDFSRSDGFTEFLGEIKDIVSGVLCQR
ncbi:armadillo repeat-containing protein 5 [Cephus cinctus]|uniref:Armadillo repeat-containing protein 5 n=1 Tax=Cephus cinctus TaxID=211228 RepID=A0AAJ7RIW7_CEPCN|nr:armadillo repeat-containing protein 5 [Cephus cinctus]XP_015597252.1 armadillo repeat-containing protein 5 [Cephus cinctus]XP_024941770.1 armadillo repeat-containing protein 5 [Cephus cinctus]